MGCDIHAYLERKFDDEWHMITPIKGYVGDNDGRGGQRDYAFFARLCGVRASYDDNKNSHPEPKGLPHDVSTVVKWHSDTWDADGHSHSWENATEFVEKKLVLDRLRDKDNELHSQDWESYKILSYSIDEDGDELTDNSHLYRVVFWFDN